jgi:cyanate permease
LLPWLFLAAWLVAAGANYVAIGVHQLFAFDRSMWAAQLVVIAAVSLVPPLFGLAMLILLRRRALAGGWKAVGAATVLVGACGILLAPSVSVFLAPFLMPAGGP